MSRQCFTGRTASSGVAVGVLRRIDHPEPGNSPVLPNGDPASQLTKAFQVVADRLLADAERLDAKGRQEQAEILKTIGYLAMDPELRGRAIDHANHGLSLDSAVQRAVDSHAEVLAALPDPTLAERAADVRQVGKRVIAQLYGHQPLETDEPLILVATEIGAADLLEPTVTVAAAASVTGGPNSHAAIVARSLGIPLLVGLDSAILEQADGRHVVVDGERGAVIVDPHAEEKRRARDTMRAVRRRREVLAAERHLPARTRDGHLVTLRANVATPAETRTALTAQADGIGLLRTELPFLQSTEWPSEAAHSAILNPILHAANGRPVTIRTLDFADDKLPPFLTRGRTGRLGRGLPLMLDEPHAFARQFRAILRAGAGHDVRIMIPMVASEVELDACQRLLATEASQIGDAEPPLGVMIELPEAVQIADRLARRAAFLSIGSNDLTGQLLGLSRRDPAFTPALAAHPKVLRAIADTVTAAHRHGRQVSVCGDAAADPLVLPLLVGLGCDVLSVAPAQLDMVRGTVRRLDYATCAAVAQEALRASSATPVWDAVREHCTPVLP